MTDVKRNYTFRRGLTVKNRIVMAPMTTKMSFYDGVITKDEQEYYASRSGSVGLLVTGAAHVRENGKGWEGGISVSDDRFIVGLSELASSIRKNGTKAILQIFHAGRMSNSKILRGETPVSASSVSAIRPDAEIPVTLSDAEIVDIINDFKSATKGAIEAGFDGVEIHGANTYLIQQFFSPHSNRREDRWGGTVEKRFEFIKRIVEEVTKVADTVDNFIVGYRFSPEELEEPGIRFEDTLYLVNQLSDMNLDYLHVSLGHYAKKSNSQRYQDKSMAAYISDEIKNRVPLVVVGSIENQQDVQGVLSISEFIAVGRAILIDPNWTDKILTGKEEYIHRTFTIEEAKNLKLSNGVLEFLSFMAKDRIK